MYNVTSTAGCYLYTVAFSPSEALTPISKFSIPFLSLLVLGARAVRRDFVSPLRCVDVRRGLTMICVVGRRESGSQGTLLGVFEAW